MNLKLALCAAFIGTVCAQEAPKFRVETRLVEVPAAVLDSGGRHLFGLTRDDFEVRDNGRPQSIASFEETATDLHCALLLDTTGSMMTSLPALKNAVSTFIDELRPNDSVSIHSFAERIRELQPATRDKSAAKRSIFGLRAAGQTALFDAISRLSLEMEKRPGKKAMVVFTDGEDNASLLNSQSAVARARRNGLPIYAIGFGASGRNAKLIDTLKSLSTATGGICFPIRSGSEMAKVFTHISAELKAVYLLSYAPPEAQAAWHQIDVVVKGRKDAKVRAKQGYSAD
ncbi:MAG: VWA domain-containing protein [Bryobacteraceae bacterium]